VGSYSVPSCQFLKQCVILVLHEVMVVEAQRDRFVGRHLSVWSLERAEK
jgi:hypothetical protein